MSQVEHLERRASPRASFTGITLVHTPAREIHGVAGNLSESGILIYPQRPPETPRRMRLTFALPSSLRWIELSGTLVRQDHADRRPAWGVRFEEVPGDIRNLLQRYVRTVRRVRGRSVTPVPAVAESAPAPVLTTPPPIPREALEESTETSPGSPFDETTGRLPPGEAALLASSLRADRGPPTRRTPAEELEPLRRRCREDR